MWGYLLVGSGEEANSVEIPMLDNGTFLQDGRGNVVVIHNNAWPCWEATNLGENDIVDMAVVMYVCECARTVSVMGSLNSGWGMIATYNLCEVRLSCASFDFFSVPDML